MMHKAWSSIEEVPYYFSRSSVKFQGHRGQKIADFYPNCAFPDCNSSLNSLMAWKWCTKLTDAYIDGLMQERCNSSALAMELCLSCINPSLCVTQSRWVSLLFCLVRVIKDKVAYFATKIQKTMKGLGTDDSALIRVIVSRCEADMVQIKEAFQKLFNGALADWIRVSGLFLFLFFYFCYWVYDPPLLGIFLFENT